MDEIDFNSDEWKEKLKGRTPEEIAETVGRYYEEKYERESPFPAKRIIGLVFFSLVLIFILAFFYRLFSNIARR